ncbi:MAG: hypothetical protein JNL01_00930 [Bdellovibrionales bacterium]|nr:hypothetical protein [Bdellovibrionales bacterium]
MKKIYRASIPAMAFVFFLNTTLPVFAQSQPEKVVIEEDEGDEETDANEEVASEPVQASPYKPGQLTSSKIFTDTLYDSKHSTCSKSYFEKAKRLNRNLGLGGSVVTLGGGIAGLGALAVIGGIVGLGYEGYDFVTDWKEGEVIAGVQIPNGYDERLPMVRLPLATNYFDTMNLLNFATVRQDASLGQSDDATVTSMLVYSAALAGFESKKVKACQKSFKKQGLRKGDMAYVESNIFQKYYNLKDMRPTDMAERKRIAYAECLFDITSQIDGSHPVYDALTWAAMVDQKDAKLKWRLKSMIRLTADILEEAQKKLPAEKVRELTMDEISLRVAQLDQAGTLCENISKPMGKKAFIQAILK